MTQANGPLYPLITQPIPSKKRLWHGVEQDYTLRELNLTMCPNRLMYSPQLHRYIRNLTELGAYFDRGIRINVKDSRTGLDRTTEIILKLLGDRAASGELKVEYAQLQELGRHDQRA